MQRNSGLWHCRKVLKMDNIFEFIMGFELLMLTFLVITLIVLMVKRAKSKKEETFEERDN